ncbi:MarR family winged helix-turn-helix transcriptional regulator [Alkalihalobacillus sp. FSL W8-0930]
MSREILFKKMIEFITSIHQVKHELTKDAKPSSITQGQYNILELITVSQPISPSEISDCLNMSKSNTSRELTKLSEKNLLHKWSDAEDHRKQFIQLSNAGENMMNEAFATIESRFSNRLEHLSKVDLEEIEQAMQTLNEKLLK